MKSNNDHRSILDKRVSYWNNWRNDNQGIGPDFSNCHTGGLGTKRAINFFRVNFFGAFFEAQQKAAEVMKQDIRPF